MRVLFFLIIFSFAFISRTQKPPHVLFVITDDLGWHDVGFHGSKIHTPTLDSLANEGIILNHYYVQLVCTPTRASIMTGRYPIRYGMSHYVLRSGEPRSLPLNETIMPQKFKDLGYKTHAIGKWHLGFNVWEATPTYRGFDSFIGFWGGGEQYYTHETGGGYDFRLNKDVDWNDKGKYSGLVFSEHAVEIVQNHPTDQPLFLYLAFQDVHSPAQVPESYVTPYNDIFEDKERRTFAGMVSVVDEGVKNVTNALKARGMWEDTLMIFTTDNGGPMSKVVGGDSIGANNWPLRGGKHSIWEGGIRGTAFIHGKGLKSELLGTTCNELMHAVDWYPTLMSAVGGNTKGSLPLDGINQWKVFSEGAKTERKEILINIDPLHDSGSNAGIRVGNYKLLWGPPGPPDNRKPPPAVDVRLPEIGIDEATIRLFDIINDPYEENNIAEKNPSVVSDLMSRLLTFNKTMVYPQNTAIDPKSSPKLHNGTWVPWMSTTLL